MLSLRFMPWRSEPRPNVVRPVVVARKPRVAISENAEIYRKSVRQKAYKFLFVALAVKLAMADGEVNNEENKALARIFALNENNINSFRDIVSEAEKDDTRFEHYVQRIATFFPFNRKLFKDTVASLFELAASDGAINSEEISFLKTAIEKFDLPAETFFENLRHYIIPASTEPYDVLNVGKSINAEGLKKAYHNAVSAYHPDRIKDVHIANIASERVQIINDAYRAIKKQKNFK